MSDRLPILQKELLTPPREVIGPCSRGVLGFVPVSPFCPPLDHRNEVVNYPKRPTQKIDQFEPRPQNHVENDF
jgi:hypothetical protein